MNRILPDQVTPQVRALFDPGEPASLRCFAVLEGDGAGRILVDHAARPTWGVVQEVAFGSIYVGGAVDAPLMHRLVDELRAKGDVLIGLWPGDERIPLLPGRRDYEGSVLDFADRPAGARLDEYLRVLPGCEIRRMDRELFERCADRDLDAAIFGGVEKALERGRGMCLLRGDEILSEAFAGPSALGMIEIGTETQEAHRGRGYATLVCAHLIHDCEQRGYRTYWNCDKANLASAAVARKLGFRLEREYRLFAWFRA